MDYKDTTLKFIILCIYYNITYFNVYTLTLYVYNRYFEKI